MLPAQLVRQPIQTEMVLFDDLAGALVLLGELIQALQRLQLLCLLLLYFD